MKTYPDLSKSIGIVVDSLRKERKMTKTALAVYANLEECYVRGIIKGRRNPTIFVIQALCEALGVSVGEFFGMVDKEMRQKVV